MSEEKIKQKKLEKNIDPNQIAKTNHKPYHSPQSYNEIPVDLLNPRIKRWIKVIKPSRSSLTYERYE